MNVMQQGVGRLAVGLAISAAVSGICWAEWQANPGGNATTALSVMSGKIAAIDLKQKRLTLASSPLASRDFVIDAKTQIREGQQRISLERLQTGSDATVEYINKDGQHVAQSVTLNSQSQEQPKAGAAPSEPERTPEQMP